MDKCGKGNGKSSQVDSTGGMSFWKNNSKTVPGRYDDDKRYILCIVKLCRDVGELINYYHLIGVFVSSSRPSPHKESLTWSKPRGSGGGGSSFQDFQDSVRDAWDIGDDEFNVMSTGEFGTIRFVS
jgi:hypothetical protein